MFSEDIEEDKRLLHEIVVNECKDSLDTFNKQYDLKLSLKSGMFTEDKTNRRLRIIADVKRWVGRFDLQQLQQLQRLELSNLSYENIEITTPPNETIIYLDPPYINTAKYNKEVCHKELYKWIDTLIDKGYKVYLSSYESDLHCVLEMKHRSTLSATSNNKVTEKLYSNTIDKKTILTATQGSLF